MRLRRAATEEHVKYVHWRVEAAAAAHLFDALLAALVIDTTLLRVCEWKEEERGGNRLATWLVVSRVELRSG